MSYPGPGRPPMVQGLPMAYMQMTGPPPPLMPAVMPLQHVRYKYYIFNQTLIKIWQMVPVQVTTPTSIRALPRLNATREQLKQMQGPPVTVFVGECGIKFKFISKSILVYMCSFLLYYVYINNKYELFFSVT